MPSDKVHRWINRGLFAVGVGLIAAKVGDNEFTRRLENKLDESRVTIGKYSLSTANIKIPFTNLETFILLAENITTKDVYGCSSLGGPYQIKKMVLTQNGVPTYQDLSNMESKREGDKKCAEFEHLLRKYATEQQ